MWLQPRAAHSSAAELQSGYQERHRVHSSIQLPPVHRAEVPPTVTKDTVKANAATGIGKSAVPLLIVATSAEFIDGVLLPLPPHATSIQPGTAIAVSVQTGRTIRFRLIRCPQTKFIVPLKSNKTSVEMLPEVT